MTDATIYYLEMRNAAACNRVSPPHGFWVKRIQPADPELNAWFYRQVGQAWQWTDRLSWSRQDWQAYACRAQLMTFVAYQDQTSVGYFELERQPEHTVQLAYFGLLADYIGHGLGGVMLSAALERAWALAGTRRVWVHTCSDDHPNALTNYEKRGFRRFQPPG